jgi:hypothetical protein
LEMVSSWTRWASARGAVRGEQQKASLARACPPLQAASAGRAALRLAPGSGWTLRYELRRPGQGAGLTDHTRHPRPEEAQSSRTASC